MAWRGGRRRTWAAGLTMVGVIVAATVALGLLVADDGGGPAAGPAAEGLDRWSLVEVDPGAPYLPTLANADLAVGANRVSFTVVSAEGVTLGDLRIQARLYDLDRDRQRPLSETTAQFIDYGAESAVPRAHTHAEGASLSDNARHVGAGVYVLPLEFPRASLWGLELEIGPGSGDGPVELVRFRLQVREHSLAPNVGEAAVAVASPTLALEPDIARITSDPRPEPGLYQVSLPAALERPRPLVLIFATPGFCHSRTCGPSLEIVKRVWRDFAGRIDAIHLEVFENPDEPDALRESAAFLAWNLPSEPWVFVIDAEGRIVSRYEGTITEPELRADVAALLGE